jgi:hypothetical protein
MYYQKSTAVYIGDYIPAGNTDLAGFSTSGKTRGLILTKLEELIRNKQIITYSSRFYDELKTFVWQDNKVSAMKGENDDLVMSLAIGTWLYDASADHSKGSSEINKAMLAAMSVNTKHFNGVSNSISQNEHIRNVQAKRDLVTGGRRQQQGMIPPELAWIYRG